MVKWLGRAVDHHDRLVKSLNPGKMNGELMHCIWNTNGMQKAICRFVQTSWRSLRPPQWTAVLHRQIGNFIFFHNVLCQLLVAADLQLVRTG